MTEDWTFAVTTYWHAIQKRQNTFFNRETVKYIITDTISNNFAAFGYWNILNSSQSYSESQFGVW